MFLLSCMLLGATYGFSQNSIYLRQSNKRLQGTNTELKMHYGANGVVRVKGKDQCDVWIDIQDGDRMLRYNPMNLPEELRVDGREISFDYGVPVNATEKSCLGLGIYVEQAKFIYPRDEKR